MSVTDRPGNWGELFDAIVARADHSGDLVVLSENGNRDDAFTLANRTIIAQSLTIAASSRHAVVVWEGTERSGSDFTAEFAEFANAVGFVRREILI